MDADVPAVRILCNEAYRELAEMGLNYTATYQDEAVTRDRMQKGTTFVLVDEDGSLLATVNVRAEDWKNGPRRTAYVGQFAVTPRLKRQGWGRRIMDFVEDWAREQGFDQVQLDTAQPALHLVDWYRRLGYRIIDETRFEGKTYASWIFEKDLHPDVR